MDNKYDIISLDFPWGKGIYGERKNKKTKFGGGAEGHYKTMSKKQILEFKSEIDKVSADQCMMLMWVTGPSLDFALEAMRHFGFKYVTLGPAWVKVDKEGEPRVLPSYYFGSNLEFIIIGIKGKPKGKFAPKRKLVGQVMMTELREHSRKPDETFKKIDLAYPHLSKCEFFSRETREGWTCFGDEVGKFDGEKL